LEAVATAEVRSLLLWTPDINISRDSVWQKAVVFDRPVFAARADPYLQYLCWTEGHSFCSKHCTLQNEWCDC